MSAQQASSMSTTHDSVASESKAAPPRRAGRTPHADPACGAVVSDLHLFTNRTTVHEHMHEIRQAAEECALFVFNGDIFDFQWSLHGGYEDSVHAAEQWIKDLAYAHRNTHCVFLLGNHDSIPAYRHALTELQEELTNLEWHEHWYRHGRRIFLHGDVYHAGTSHQALGRYRERCSRELRRSRIRHACYWALSRSGLPSVFLRFVKKDVCARRILAYLTHELSDTQRGTIEEVYFGHVHTPFADFRYDGLLFHNTGAATTGARLNVMRFPLDDDE
jgi:UDP-2,3-diacylglucosamine hydrolase